MKQPVAISDNMKSFLQERMSEDREDGEIAYRFSTHVIEWGDPDALNWFDIREVDQAPRISYATPYSVSVRGTSDPFKPGGHRTSAKPAGVAQKVTGVTNGRALDVFSSSVHAFLLGSPPIVVVEGEEITKRYSANLHCGCVGSGDLGRSCMRYPEFAKFFKFYEHTAKMAIIVCPKCNGTRARGILWTDVNGRQFLDRIYGGQVSVEQMRTWAKERDIPYIWQGLGHGVPTKHGKITIAVPDMAFESAPYLDSLFHWCRTCNALSQTRCEDRDHDRVQLRGTHGVNHPGWWGICPSCRIPYGDGGQVCRNSARCSGCGDRYCGDACPNGCVRCSACATVRRADVPGCPNRCMRCACGYWNRIGWLEAQHGSCRSCGAQVHGAPPAQEVNWAQTTFGWRWSCPSCSYSYRAVGAMPQENGLIACAEVHRGRQMGDGGHCPSCHAFLHINDPEPNSDRPIKNIDEAFQNWSVRQARKFLEGSELA